MPAGMIQSPQHMRDIFAEQQRQLGTDYFDYYLIHNTKGWLYDQKIRPFGMFEFTEQMKKAGAVHKVGFSFHDCPEDLERILGEHPEVDFVQLVINYYDWDSSWVQSRRCYEIARKHGKQVIIMEPVKGGMLAHPPVTLREEMERRDPGSTPTSWAFRFAGGLEGVLAILSGMSTPAQVKENVKMMQSLKPLTEAERQMLLSSTPEYRAMGPYGLRSFDAFSGLAQNRMPVNQVLENYNIIQLQRSYGTNIAAENNY